MENARFLYLFSEERKMFGTKMLAAWKESVEREGVQKLSFIDWREEVNRVSFGGLNVLLFDRIRNSDAALELELDFHRSGRSLIY